MAYNETATLGFAVDASGAETGINSVKRSLNNLADTARTVGQTASTGLDSIGEGGSRVTQSFDKTTRNLISSIQRTTATMEAGSRSSSDYFRTLAGQRGANVIALEPYLKQLDEVTQKQKMAKAEMAATDPVVNKLGMSQKQLAAAMRGVPAQMTDIVVSLQGGQRPLTVLLQQGGQLKDMFGGIVPAAKALGSQILSMINPFTAAAAIIGTFGYAVYQGIDESERFSRALIANGQAAGMTRDELTALSQKVGEVSGKYGLVEEAAEALAASGKLTRTEVETAMSGIAAAVTVTGQSVKELVTEFEKISEKPAESAAKLNEKYNFLTLDIYKQIVALEKQGKTQEAATLALEAFNAAMESRAPGIIANTGYIARGWQEVVSWLSSAKNYLMDIGRADTLGEQISKQKALYESLSRAQFDGAEAYRNQVGETIAQLEKQAAAEKTSARAAGDNAQKVKDQIKAYDEARKKKDKKKTNPEQSAFDNLTASIKQQIATYQLQIQTGEAATEAEKFRIKLDNEAANSKKKLTEAHKAEAKALVDKLEVVELEAKQKKFTSDYEKTYEANKRALINQYDLEIQKIGLSVQEAEKLTIANQTLFSAEEQIRKARETKSLAPGMDETILANAQKAIDLQNQLLSAKYEAANDPWKAMSESVKNYGEEANNVGKGIRDMMTNTMKATEDTFVEMITKGKISFSDLANSIISDLARIASKRLTNSLFESLFDNLGGSISSGLGSLFGFGGGKARGGPVSAGTTYMVGEKGPELFVPATSGTIVPNHALNGMAGNAGINVQINQKNEGTPQQVSSSSANFDGKSLIISIVTKDIENDGMISRSIARNFGARRIA